VSNQPTYQQVNQHPINQHALSLLRKAGEHPNGQGELGLPALMRWGLEKGGLAEPREADAQEFRDNLEVLTSPNHPPQHVMRLLLEHPEVEFPEQNFLETGDPQAAAGIGLNHLDSLLCHLSEQGYGQPTN
jgi:hypothetical protein